MAPNDEALVAALGKHVAEQHADDARSEDDIGARVASEAYEPPDRPPWAY